MKNLKDSDLFIILVIIAIVVVYLISVGTLDISKNKKLPNELNDSLKEAEKKQKQIEKAKQEQRKLQKRIKQQEEQQKRLDKRFKRIFFLVRFSFVVLWGVILFVLYLIGFNTSLEDSLNISELIILILITLHFLTFGTITNLEKYIKLIRIRIKNWIYRKYAKLNQEIELNKQKLGKMENEISEEDSF